MAEYSVVGKRLPRIDGAVKARGEAKYTVDMKLPGMLYCRTLRSPYAHAKILRIDTSKAEKLPGVKAIITGKDTKGVRYGLWRRRPEYLDEPPLAEDKVRHVGEGVAAVAAVDEVTAEEALELIDVEYEELPAVFTPEEAMREGAPLIHENVKRNVIVTRRMEFGDIERGFREAEYVREDSFSTQPVTHTPMEPQACIASYDPSGKLTLWASTQVPYFTQAIVAKAMGLRESEVKVIRPFVGGGFGGKYELHAHEICASFLARKTGKPVKLVFDRKEEFIATRRKHPMTVTLKTGVKRDGTIVAIQAKAVLDGGAYSGIGPTTTMLAGIFFSMAYRVPNYRYDGFRAFTNKPPSGAMRGHGANQPIYAIDSQLDLIAADLGMDPVAIRLKNARQTGDLIPSGLSVHGVTRLSSCGLGECIQRVTQSTDWAKKRAELPPGRGIGIGTCAFLSGAIFNYFNTTRPYSEVLVRVNDDGTATIFSQAAEIGQGSDTMLCQIVAEELGLKMGDVSIGASDTATAPQDLGSWASRTTLMTGNAAKAAAAEVKSQLFLAAAGILGQKLHQELDAREGRIFIKGNPEHGISFADAVQAAQAARNGMPIMGRGAFTPKGGERFTPALSFGAQIAEVEVDKETGQVKVLKVTTAHDCGQAINPMAVEGQVEGSVQLALGYALTEELQIEKGQTLNPTFMDYKILSAADMPPVESIVVETYEPEGPFGAKEAGEGITPPTPGAIANAVEHATGVRVKSIPITPEKLLKAIKEKKGGK